MTYATQILEIEDALVTGDLALDRPLWGKALKFVADTAAPMAYRVRALRVVDRIIKQPDAKCDEQAVNETTEMARQMCIDFTKLN